MKKGRIWEVDFLRVVAIVLMTIFHFIYDLREFAGINIDYRDAPWRQIGTSAALLFMFISGISSGLSRSTVSRGIKVLGYGMIVTVATYIAIPDIYIRFGILHFLGASMILSPVLRRLNNWVLAILAAIIAYNPFSGLVLNSGILLPLGIKYRGFASADYYPLVPYLSVFILGILAYKLYYYKKQSFFSFSIENPYLTYISKNSLIIYLIHQPIIIAGLYLLNYI